MRIHRCFTPLVALAMAGAPSTADAVCAFSQANGQSSCAAPVKDLLIVKDSDHVAVRLHDTNAEVLACILPSGYWQIPKSAPNYESALQLAMLSAATNLRVEITSNPNNTGTCIFDGIRLVND